MKIEIELVAAAMKKENIDPAKLRAVIELLQHEAEGEDEEKAPARKKQFAVIVYDKDGVIPQQDFVASIVQIPEEESVATTLDRVYQSVYEFNVTRKGRLLPLTSVGEAMENLPAKITKLHDLWIKTKTPVLVIKSNNLIPKAVSE